MSNHARKTHAGLRRTIVVAAAIAAVGTAGVAAYASQDGAQGTKPDAAAAASAAKAAAAAEAAKAADPYASFYVDPDSNPARWVAANGGDGRAAKIRSSIAANPMARWFGNWSGDVTSAAEKYTKAAAAKGKAPVLVAYNIPGRDCGGHSGGGAGNAGAYEKWITNLAKGIGSRPAVVVVEPDAIAQLDCLKEADRPVRLGLMRHAAQTLKQYAPKARVYLDGGNSTWIPAATMAQRLKDAGVTSSRGFSVNVSNYQTTKSSTDYGNAVAKELKNRFGLTKSYVVDTSRNGKGPAGDNAWCNPAGRKLGTTSRVGTGGAESLLWLKVPGDSDGDCGIGAGVKAGDFSPAIAMHLINGG
jgi:endoglucanase